MLESLISSRGVGWLCFDDFEIFILHGNPLIYDSPAQGGFLNDMAKMTLDIDFIYILAQLEQVAR